ncbi:MAG: sensor histidine kinase [Pedobacter sp.]|nr:MAG: sensor histidine kinase [Pedobacter sp.]
MKLPLMLIPLYFSVFILSCSHFKEDGKAHPEYFDEVIKIGEQKLRISYEIADKYLDSAYNAFPNASNFDQYRKYKLKSEFLNISFHNYSLALTNIDSAIMMLEQNNPKTDNFLAEAYILKGNILVNQNNFDDAFKYFFLAKSVNEKNKDLRQIAYSNSSLANVLYQQQKYKEAIKYYRETVEISKRIQIETKQNTFITQQQHLNNIALCYEKLNMLDSAKNAYLIAIKFVSDAETNVKPANRDYYNMAKGIMYGNLGSTYYKLKDYTNSELAYKKSLQLNKGDEQDAFFTKIKLATLYLTINRDAEALVLINEIKTLFEEKNRPYLPVDLRLRELSWKYYDKIGNTYQAYHNFKDYHQLKDSIDLASISLSKKDFNKEFIKLAQASEIESLKKQDEIKTVYLLLAIGFTILSAFIIILILRNARVTKQNIKNLKVLNAKISGHNELMQKTLEALEQSQEENTHMMQVVAHDMRTPIAGVIGLTALMLEEDDLNDEQREILSMINTSGADTLNFINDLLQVQYNKSNLIKEPVEMHTLLKYCITLLDSKAKEKNQQLTIQTIPIEINISREKIWRVMSNLISNAIKFSPHGTIISIEMEEKPLSILIKVKDNGIGIPEDLASKLFNMDAAVQREGTDGEKSFGLGLAISKQIIEAHNGSIWFESLPGFGTTFFVELPITEN